MRALIDGQFEMLGAIERRIEAIEAQLQALQSQFDSARRVRAIPGVGPLGATALAAVLGEDARGTATGASSRPAWGWCPGIQAPEAR